MMRFERVIRPLGIYAFLILGTAAYASVVLPANDTFQTLGAPEALPAGSYIVAPGALSTITTSAGLAGTLYEGVYQESGTGFLDFVYQIMLSQGGGVGLFTADNYNWDGGATADSGGILNSVPSGFLTPSGNPSDTPGSADRTTDFDRIHFMFSNYSSTDNSAIFFVHTEATTYRGETILVQDTGQIEAQGFAPAPEPVSAGLLLGGLFGVGLIAARKFRVK